MDTKVQYSRSSAWYITLHCHISPCIEIYHHALWYITLYHDISSCTVIYHPVLWYIILHCDISSCTVIYHPALWYIILHCAVSSCTVIYRPALWYITLHCDISSCTVLYHPLMSHIRSMDCLTHGPPHQHIILRYHPRWLKTVLFPPPGSLLPRLPITWDTDHRWSSIHQITVIRYDRCHILQCVQWYFPRHIRTAAMCRLWVQLSWRGSPHFHSLATAVCVVLFPGREKAAGTAPLGTADRAGLL